jgi:hypothetical protein
MRSSTADLDAQSDAEVYQAYCALARIGGAGGS